MPDPVKLDFSRATPIQSGSGVQLDFSGALPLSSGPDDPNGNYDFGDLGSVKGARINGRPATRQEAFGQLAGHRAFAQTMGETFQGKQQDVSNFIQSNTDTDQATKAYMGDLAGMLAGGAAGGAGKILRAARWSEGADALAGLVRSYAPKPAQNAVGKLLGVDALEQQTSPTVFRQFGKEYHMPISGPPPGPRAGAPPILTPFDAAQQREAGTAAQLPFLKPTQSAPPQQVAEQPVATDRGTWSADPRTGEQILQSVQNMRGGGQGKVAMGVSQGSAATTRNTGFGTAQTPIEETSQGAEMLAQRAAKRPPVQSPVSQEPPVTTPGDMTGYYGKTAGRSSLKANKRQLASPTGSTAPNPGNQGPHPANIMKILNTPGDISDADMQTLQNYFAQKRLTNMLGNAAMQKAAGQ